MKIMAAVLLFSAFLLLLVVGLPLWMTFSTHNRLMSLDTRCDTAFADIDVLLKHRHSLLPGLVETVRGFAKHEDAVISNVAKARTAALGASSPSMKLEAEQQLGQSIHAILNVAESYPDLKASAHFRDLSNQLVDVENRVTASRRFYNLAVEEYNSAIRQFPGNRVAHYRRMSARRPFELGVERMLLDEPVAIQF
jgi:LemA protein